MWTAQRTYPETVNLGTRVDISKTNRNFISHGDTLKLQGSKESEVYRVINEGNSAPNMKPKSCSHCYRCGGTTHKSSEGYFRNGTCRKCGKVGHIQRVCRSGKSQNSTRRRKEEKPNLHAFEVDDERDDDSLVALPKVNNLKQVEAGYVIW